MDVAVIGAGYVGLATAGCFSEIGHNAASADGDLKKLELLQQGEVPFFEPYLSDLVRRNLAAGRLRFMPTEDLARQHEAGAFDGVGVRHFCITVVVRRYGDGC